MDQDFDGEYEDVEGNDDQSGSDEEGDDDRLDDEMGNVGDQGNTVDERLWDQEDNKEPDGSNDDEVENDATAPVTDKSQLDYMEGQVRILLDCSYRMFGLCSKLFMFLTRLLLG